MAYLGQKFEIEKMPENEKNFEPLPAGWYTATIGSAWVGTTKSGTGQYIAVRYNITGPTHAGRVVYGNLNIRNESGTAERIGLAQFGELMKSLGLRAISDSDELIGGDVQIKLSIREKPGYEPSNDVRAFKPVDGGGWVERAAEKPAGNGRVSPPWAK